MKAFNATAESIREVEQQIAEASVIEVVDSNMEAVEIFIGCKIDRLVTPGGTLIFEGIKRESIPFVAEMLGFKRVDKETFLTIRTLENFALEILNRGS